MKPFLPDNAAIRDTWRPVFLNSRDEVQSFQGLDGPGCVLAIHDTILEQMRDLTAIRHPERKLSEAEIGAAIAELLGRRNPGEYGRWVFYPWSGRLVHLLGREEFREVRLSRNRNKITTAEQTRLAQITVGVVGLSVGNAVARTLALEGCGRLKLADFDRLDLSNLNRLQAGVHEIGLNKSVLAARQIYELDPDASISVFPVGVTADNVDEFLLDSPWVDVVVDECDSLDVKVLLRERARALRLPVLMETSDRGMLDVERFDCEPQRPSFHGLVGHLKAAELKQLSMKDKVTHVLNILGSQTMSSRLAASLVEIEQTLSTWPQLASDVALGGATVATAVRRIALGEPLLSGRHYVDLEMVLAEASDELKLSGEERALQSLQPTTDSPSEHDPSPETYAEVSPLLSFLVEYANLAPSGGNCQPWRFFAEDEVLHVMHDRRRSRNLLDKNHLGSYIALGAAIENVSIAAAHRGLKAAIDAFPSHQNPAWIATVQFEPTRDETALAPAALFEFLPKRVTVRRSGPTQSLDSSEARALSEAAAVHGATLELHSERSLMEQVGQILGEGDRVRFLCAELHRELVAELRWSQKEAENTRDGIDLATLELTPAEAAAMRVLARPDTAAALRAQNAGGALMESADKAIRGACAVGLIRVDGEDSHHFLQAGRAIQRVWLGATRLRLGFQPMTALLFMLRILDGEESGVFLERERQVLRGLSRRIDDVFPDHAPRPRAMLFRLTRATEVTARALRRPVSEVLFSGRPNE